jgi:hypothetical protein
MDTRMRCTRANAIYTLFRSHQVDVVSGGAEKWEKLRTHHTYLSEKASGCFASMLVEVFALYPEPPPYQPTNAHQRAASLR